MRKVSNLSEFHRAQLKALNKGCVKSPSIDRTAWNGGLQGYNTKWDSPYDNVPVTDSERDRILKNIRNAFRSQGFEIV